MPIAGAQGSKAVIEDVAGAADTIAASSDAAPTAEAAAFGAALPKAEIQAESFLKQHPEYDGRGVVVAVLDTGVDPGVDGLLTTTTGAAKLIDVIDATGSGDVLMNKIVTDVNENFIQGALSGTLLKLNPDWKNPTGEWRVGAKAAYDLFPAGLKKRTKEERRRRFDERQRTAVTAATAALAAHVTAHGKAPTDAAVKKQREELEMRIKLLEDMMSKYEDLGPMIQAVVWHDGEKWMAALDTSEFYDGSDTSTDTNASDDSSQKQGLLADFEPLTNYRDCLRFGTFSAADACNFAVNIYDDGAILSIVVDRGSHGTHVAGITSAHFSDAPELNGVAPGAQIVSIAIGDQRMGSMETGTGVSRALAAIAANKVDLINMSYGESTSTPNQGRLIKLAEEIVYKHDVIFVASAGNAGPALGTVGAPGGTSSAILGVGAFVTPPLAKAGHSLRSDLAEGAQYTWSSRGPSPDGDIGVTFSAPGGAIAPVPAWTTSKMQLMNGTSMASPCACGGIALIISALKAQGQPVTPARIRRAIENTALPIGTDPVSTLTSGRGLLQVDDAYNYLQQGEGSHLDDTLRDLRLEVSCRRTDGTAKNRGIYLRDPADTLRSTAFAVEVSPHLKEDADVRSAKLGVDLKLALSSSAPWVKAPSMLMLHHGGRSFEVEVDPSNLPEGLHYAEVCGTLVGEEWRGPLFRCPVTVIKPLQLTAQPGRLASTTFSSSDTSLVELQGARVCLGKFDFVPGREVRRFISVPEGATWAELRLQSVTGDTQKIFLLRATAVLPHTRYSDSEHRAAVQLAPHAQHNAAFAVTAGTTLELTLAQFWSSLGDSAIDAELTFHGVEVAPADGGNCVLDGGAGGPLKLFARAPLRREKIKPTAKLDTVRIPLRPIDGGELMPLSGPRDEFPGGRTIHRLVLTYKVTLTEGGKVTPRVPLLNRFVYDGEVEAQMSFIMDANKQVFAINDIYPSDVSLSKGDYTILLHLRHDNPALLDKLRSIPLVLDRKLESSISLPIRSSHIEAIQPGSKDISGKEKCLVPGERTALFIGPLADESKLPKDATPGRLLLGKISVGAKSANNGGNGGEAPGALQLSYVVPPKKSEGSGSAAAASTSSSTGTTDSSTPEATKKSPEDLLKEAVRDAEVKFLTSMKTDAPEEKTAYENLLADLTARFPGHLPILREPLTRLNALHGDIRNAGVLDKIISAADAILAAIDTTALAVYLARKSPEIIPGAEIRKKEMEERKAAVIQALAAKCLAYLDLEEEKLAELEMGPPAEASLTEEEKSQFTKLIEETYELLGQWIEPTSDAAYALLAARREARAERPAAALKALDKVSNPEDKPTGTKEILEKRVALFEKLGWKHWARVERSRIVRAFPAGSPPL